MAKLISDNFTMDIQLANYSNGAINYHIEFKYGKQAFLNPLVTNNKYFIVPEFKEDYLMLILEQALKITLEEHSEHFEETLKQKSFFWVPNSTIGLMVTPVFHLGFKDARNPEKMSPMFQQKLRAIDELREMGAQFPGDTFVLDFGIQVKGLKILRGKPINWIGNGLIFTIMVKRPVLRNFFSELLKEYKEFRRKFKVNELGGKVQEFLDGKAKSEEISVLEKQFDQEMRKIYWEAKKLGMCGDGFIGSIEDRGGRDAAKFLLKGKDSTTGADKLRFYQITKGKGLELTAEYLAAQPKWSNLFTKKEIKTAKKRLERWK